MKHWEFLIQKEGDPSWKSINAPNLELEEGKYRVAARFGEANVDVEIRFTYQATREASPQSCSHAQLRRTNPEGLMVVMPFTYLEPGIWTLRCCGDILSELLGEFWQKSLQMQVLPKTYFHQSPSSIDSEGQERGVSEQDLEPHPVSSTEEPNRQKVFLYFSSLLPSKGSDEVADHQADTDSSSEDYHSETTEDDPSDPSLPPLEEIVFEPETAATESANSQSNGHSETAAPPFQLTLEQDIFFGDRGESILISGQIASLRGEPYIVFNQRLRICLRDPQTLQILLDAQPSLEKQALPLAFSYSLEIPTDCQSYLVVGEVILEGYLESGEHKEAATTILARQPFTISVNLGELVEKVFPTPSDPADHLEDNSEQSSFYFQPEEDQSPTSPPQQSESVSSPVLPPKISPSRETKKVTQSPQLPKIPNRAPTTASEGATATREAEETSQVAADTPVQLSGVKDEFPASQAQERFWSRLSALATTSEDEDTEN